MKMNTESQKRTKRYLIADPFTLFKTYCHTKNDAACNFINKRRLRHRRYFLLVNILKILRKKNFMAPFYGWGSIVSRPEPLRGGSLLFTTKFPEIHGAHFINLGRMTLEPPSGLEHGNIIKLF